MSDTARQAVMNAGADLVFPPVFESPAAERRHNLARQAAAFRLFGKFGFDEGVAGHITVRDPERRDCFWVNPMGVSFKQIRASDLLLVDHAGTVVEGRGLLNTAAFMIHSRIHAARPDVNAAAHAHSVYGKALSALGEPLLPLTQDACAFYDDHALFEDFSGVVLDPSEGEAIAAALGDRKACILQNHGLLTVAATIEAAAWWYITLERSAQAQLLAKAAGTPIPIRHDEAIKTREVVGSPLAGWFSFRPLFDTIAAEQPDLLD